MPEDDDKKIWTAYARGIKPLKPMLRAPAATTPQPTKPSPATWRSVENKKTAPLPGRANFHAALERNLERRLRQGMIVPEGRIDLHGMHEAEAHKALIDFIDGQANAGHRRLLVITGKGRGGQGILRARIKDWLAASSVRANILALRPAAIRHGGAGAFYVLLKKGKIRHA